MDRRDVGCWRITYEEAGLTYLVSQFTDPHLISGMPRGIRVSFGDITSMVKDVIEARAYVARQRDISRKHLQESEKEILRKEILRKTNEKILFGKPVIF